ncbi:MAG: aminotransferase class I/II-fold pyridoxal phosphate-dependent enzyme [Candidatus Nanopelagicales bacterium]|nr:aminotransferase class I/II-fold pyridoxal phosphate-dependent enzyme [Candidatus Nanopelagicales bacterium]
MSDFSWVPLEELRLRSSVKWRAYSPDVIPVWVAEMDVRLATPITERLRRAVELGDTGYAWTAEVGEALGVFAATRWNWIVDSARVMPVADVLTGVGQALIALTEPGDAVVINSPVYPPFFTTVQHVARRELRDVPLVWDGQRYVLDREAMERAFADPSTRAYLMCSPHNPTGRVFDREELRFIASLADRHGVLVVADEIHAPTTYPDRAFVPYLTVSGDAPAVSVISASKAWNLAGLKCAQVVAGSADVRDKLRARVPLEVQHGAGHLGALAAIVAYTEGTSWLDELLEQLQGQSMRLRALMAKQVPQLTFAPPEASFLAWLDCRALELPGDPAAFFLAHGQVALNSGPTFGPGGAGFARLNFATSPEVLDEVVARMASAVASQSAIA